MDWPHALELYYEELEKHVENIVEQMEKGKPDHVKAAKLADAVESSYVDHPQLALVTLYGSLIPCQRQAPEILEYFNDKAESETVPGQFELAERHLTAAFLFRQQLLQAVIGQLIANQELRKKRKAT